MDIDLTRFPHKIQMLRACILRILSETAKVEGDRNASPHACKDPQKSQKVCREREEYLLYYE